MAVGVVAVSLATHRLPGAAARTGPGGGTRFATLTIGRRAPSIAVPRSYLGLSTEYWTLPFDERHAALYRRVVSLIRVPGGGPLILRVGGDSSDHTFYAPGARAWPPWSFELTPALIARTAELVRQLHLRVILDLNLVTSTPELEAAWAREAEAELPRGSIIGFEIGNEPDLYDRAFWLRITRGETFTGDALPDEITPAVYAQDFDSYARVLSEAVPGVPLLGPALGHEYDNATWISALLAGPHPGLSEITAHRYPYSACSRDPAARPTVERILGDRATVGLARSVEPAVGLARAAGLPFRLTEMNSVTCGGLRGVSNTFATALWAPDALFELMHAGVAGVNLHVRVHAINAPFAFAHGGLEVRPLLYGLILFARTLGPRARLVPLDLHAPRAPRMRAWGVAMATGTLHVLLINKGPRRVVVNMRLPATGPATVERLLAPSVRSRFGATLGGQWLDGQGRWQGRPVRSTVIPAYGRYAVIVPRFSAALATFVLQRHGAM